MHPITTFCTLTSLLIATNGAIVGSPANEDLPKEEPEVVAARAKHLVEYSRVAENRLAALADAYKARTIPTLGVLPVTGPTLSVAFRPSYTSSYAVIDPTTGDQKASVENREGDLTRGSYSVVQADGVIRTVNYYVTPLSGFVTQILHDGIPVKVPMVVSAVKEFQAKS